MLLPLCIFAKEWGRVRGEKGERRRYSEGAGRAADYGGRGAQSKIRLKSSPASLALLGFNLQTNIRSQRFFFSTRPLTRKSERPPPGFAYAMRRILSRVPSISQPPRRLLLIPHPPFTLRRAALSPAKPVGNRQSQRGSGVRSEWHSRLGVRRTRRHPNPFSRKVQ